MVSCEYFRLLKESLWLLNLVLNVRHSYVNVFVTVKRVDGDFVYNAAG